MYPIMHGTVELCHVATNKCGILRIHKYSSLKLIFNWRDAIAGIDSTVIKCFDIDVS